MNRLMPVIAATVLCAGTGVAVCQTTNYSSSGSSVPADNSKTNKTDPSNRSMTPDTQKNDKSDVQITKDIRKSLMADKSLSTYAHNVKVVTVNGHVTLNGVVHTDDEKSAIESKAVSVAGSGNVDNELKVKESGSK